MTVRDYSSEEEIRAFFTGVKQAVRRAEVRGILRLCAKRREFIGYLDIGKALGMFSGGTELASCLGQIMSDNASKGEPLLSSLVIRNDTGRPGTGYFEQARSLGLLCSAAPADEEAFWQAEVRKLGLDPSLADDPDPDAESDERKPKSGPRVIERRPDGSTLVEGKGGINVLIRPLSRD